MTDFVEVADRVWVARQEWYDLNVCLIRGSSGLVVVDTQASARAARAIVEEVRALGIGDVTAIVNTHEHFDHTFGNGAFRAAYGEVPIHAHEVAAERTVEHPLVLAGGHATPLRARFLQGLLDGRAGVHGAILPATAFGAGPSAGVGEGGRSPAFLLSGRRSG